MTTVGEGPRVRRLGAGGEWADGSEAHVRSVLRKARDRSSASDELAAKIRDWPTRYHFSRLRSKILRPLRIGAGTRVLDLGGGTGPLSRKLGELGAEVVLLDGSEARAEAAAARCRDLDNVSIVVGSVFDLDDAEPFDIVLAVGLLEYAASSPGGPEGLLGKAASLLGSNGILAVAIENAIGLKYLLGYAEDHVGVPWVGWEGYLGIEQVRTYSRPELGSMLEAAGLPAQAWFYPFPDYKLPTVIVSEAVYELGSPDVIDSIVPQPCVPEASLPILLCDARAAHRTMLRADLGPDIANSFFVVAATTSSALDQQVDRETLAWLSGSERTVRFMRDRRLVSRGSDLAIVDDTVAAPASEEGWLTQRRFPVVAFEAGDPLDRLVGNAIAGSDAARTRELLTMWVQTLKADASLAALATDAEPTSPFHAEDGELALPGDFLDSQPANFVYRDAQLHRIDAEWQARGLIDFELACIRGLYHFTIDVLMRGISASRMNGRDVASVISALADAAGIENRDRALERLPQAEGELQAIVRGLPVDRARAEVDRLLTSSAEELTMRAGVPSARTSRREREEELEAELDALRRAHEAQARHLVAERLAMAEHIEHELEPIKQEVGSLREEVEWRKGVMEHQEYVIGVLQNSRSFRYTEPLRRVAALLRRR
jgi:O-antigen biosynthesis protein